MIFTNGLSRCGEVPPSIAAITAYRSDEVRNTASALRARVTEIGSVDVVSPSAGARSSNSERVTPDRKPSASPGG